MRSVAGGVQEGGGQGLDKRIGLDLDSRKEQKRTFTSKNVRKEYNGKKVHGSASHTLVGIGTIWGTCSKYKGPALSYFNQPGSLGSLSALTHPPKFENRWLEIF